MMDASDIKIADIWNQEQAETASSNNSSKISEVREKINILQNNQKIISSGSNTPFLTNPSDMVSKKNKD